MGRSGVARRLCDMRRTLTLLLLGLFVVVSCTFPGSVRPTLKIGLVAPFEGRYRYVGYDAIPAVRMALREVNRTGGVAGYSVELAAYDDGGDPAMGAQQARKLEVDDDVVAALGHFRESTTMAAVHVYARAGIPLIAPVELSPDLRAERLAYALGPRASGLAAAILDRAVELAADGGVMLVTDGGPLGDALQDAAHDRNMALRVVSDGEDRTSLPAEGDEAPAVLLCDLEPVHAGELVFALRQRGWGGDVIGGPALAAAAFGAVAEASAVDATFVTPWPLPRDVLGGAAFAASYREESGGTEPGPMALPAYEGTWMLLQALDQAGRDGEPTRDRLAEALSRVERNGFLGRLSFDERASSSDPALFWYRIGEDGVPRMSHRDGPGTIIAWDRYSGR